MVTNHNKIVESVNAHLNEVNHTLRQEGLTTYGNESQQKSGKCQWKPQWG